MFMTWMGAEGHNFFVERILELFAADIILTHWKPFRISLPYQSTSCLSPIPRWSSSTLEARTRRHRHRPKHSNPDI